MNNIFEKQQAAELIEALKTKGIIFEEGLTDREIDIAEAAVGSSFPVDYRLLLSLALPVSREGNLKVFPQWRANPLAEAEAARDQMNSMLAFDITNSDFWHPLLELKPSNVNKAIEQAQRIVNTWPPLVRVYAHRYLPTAPNTPGNPIISVWQSTDSICYGTDLCDYLRREFQLTDDNVAYDKVRSVPYWSEFFNLAKS